MKTISRITWVITFALVCMANGSAVLARTITVDCNGPADFNNIQEAIDASRDLDTIVVHPGIYEEHIDYHAKAITITSVDPNDPNIVADTVIDGNDTDNVVAFRNAETSLSVLRGLTIQHGDVGVYCEGQSTAPSIDRCTIHLNRVGIMGSSGGSAMITNTMINGNAEHGTYTSGGEMRDCVVTANGLAGLYSHSGTVIGCTIADNGENGLENRGRSVDLVDCIISGNGHGGVFAAGGTCILDNCSLSGNKGPGINCQESSFVRMSNCILCGNGSSGTHSDRSSVELSACILSANGGYGSHSWACSVARTNCIVSGNKSGGISTLDDGSSLIVNCTVVGNRGPGIRLSRTPQVSNSIVAQNAYAYEIGPGGGSWERTTHNDFSGNGGATIPPGNDNIDERPWFAVSGYWDANETLNDPTDDFWVEGDYHLMSTLGRWDPVAEEWVTDPIDSPCLDRGDPNTPIGQEPNPNGGRVNLGAYGGTAEASMSEGIKPICIEYPAMDFNKDCKVDQADLDIFMESWLLCNLDPPEACWPE